jgi:hypothetical protein
MVVGMGVIPLVSSVAPDHHEEPREDDIKEMDGNGVGGGGRLSSPMVITMEWNPYTSQFSDDSDDNATDPLSTKPSAPFIPDKNTVHICRELLPLLLDENLSPLSKTVYVPKKNESDQSKQNEVMNESNDSPATLLYKAASDIFENDNFLNRLFNESKDPRMVACAIYSTFFLHAKQPLLLVEPSCGEATSRFAEKKDIEKEGAEEGNSSLLESLGKGSHPFKYILNHLVNVGVEHLDNNLSVFFDVITMCCCNTEFSLQKMFQKLNTNMNLAAMDKDSFVYITPSSTLIHLPDEPKQLNVQTVKCAVPIINSSLLIFIKQMIKYPNLKSSLLHCLYALTDYCRICPPLRKWCLTDGLPYLRLYFCICFYVLFS